MVTRFTVVGTEAEQTAQDWLYAADEDVLGCRGQGHRFPKIRRTRSGSIRGVRVVPMVEGVNRMFSTCPDCGTVRIEDTLPGTGGMLPSPHRYHYIYPPKYRPQKGTKVTRGAAFEETMRRVIEDGGLALAAADTA
jgi:hypothetical protein